MPSLPLWSRSIQGFHKMVKEKQVIPFLQTRSKLDMQIRDESEDTRKYFSLWPLIIQVRSVIWQRDFTKYDNFCILTAAKKKLYYKPQKISNYSMKHCYYIHLIRHLCKPILLANAESCSKSRLSFFSRDTTSCSSLSRSSIVNFHLHPSILSRVEVPCL